MYVQEIQATSLDIAVKKKYKKLIKLTEDELAAFIPIDQIYIVGNRVLASRKITNEDMIENLKNPLDITPLEVKLEQSDSEMNENSPSEVNLDQSDLEEEIPLSNLKNSIKHELKELADNSCEFSDSALENETQNDDELFLISKPNYDNLVKKLDDGNFACLHCDKVAPQKLFIICHAQVHRERSTICFYCGRSFETFRKLKSHENQFHGTLTCSVRKDLNKPDRIPPRIDNYVSSRKIICHECGKGNFRSHVEYNDHLNFHSNTSPYICSCGSKFRNYCNFYTHQKKFRCPMDSVEYPPYARNTILHLNRTKKRTKEEMAEYRQKQTPSAVKQRVTHEKIDNLKPFKCETCGYKCATLSILKKHIAMRHSERTIPCPECNMMFATKQTLDGHVRTHLDFWKCDICQEIVQKRNIKKHTILHNGEDFNCGKCNFKTKSKGNFLAHCRKVHNKPTGKLLKCVICLKSDIKSTSSLGSHLLSKSHIILENSWKLKNNLKKFPCSQCQGLEFNSAVEIIKHLNLTHRVGNIGTMGYLKSLQIEDYNEIKEDCDDNMLEKMEFDDIISVHSIDDPLIMDNI